MGKVEDAVETMKQNLAEKTGKSLDAWVALARKQKLEKHGLIVSWLKSEHTLGHGYANLIAQSVLGGTTATTEGDDLLAAQYAGSKAAVKPIYDALVKVVTGFGNDIELSPKKTYVSLRRSKQFGLIQPSTAARVDVGLNLKGVTASGRLENSGSFNAMVSHRVRVGSVAEIDPELKALLKQAYDAA